MRELLDGIIQRLHIIVVGPGLGREHYMQSAAKTAIALARQHDQYIVIDADGLFLVGNEPDVIKGYKKAVLTPNVVEFARLCEKMVSKYDLALTCVSLSDVLDRVSIRKVIPTN